MPRATDTDCEFVPGPDPTRRSDWSSTRRSLLVLVGLVWVVHAAAVPPAASQSRKSKTAKPAPDKAAPVIVGHGVEGLPPAVAEMRAAIQAAAETGDIAELKGAMDLNELKPEFAGPAGTDPIAHLKNLSVDGTGRDILGIIERLLAGSWAAIPGGRDIENNRIYVWPHFTEVPLAGLSDTESAALDALVGAEPAKAMRDAGRWSGWRLSIGADGVWHMFTKVD